MKFCSTSLSSMPSASFFFEVFSVLLSCIVDHLEGLVDLSYLLSGYIFIVYAPFHVLLLKASDLIP